MRGRLPCETCRDAMGLRAKRTGGIVWGKGQINPDGDLDGRPCPCIVTVAVMRELGMSNAAAMHDQAAGEGSGGPGVHEVELHMGDEEGTLFPILRKVANGLEKVGAKDRATKLRRDVDALEKQHGEVRRLYLAKGIVPPPEVLGPHGRAEDKIVSEYAELIRIEWEAMKGSV